MSKQVIETEAELRDAAKEALGRDREIQWRWKFLPSTRESEGRVDLVLDGKRFAFDVEFKLTPSTRDIQRVATRSNARPGLLVAPSLSENLVMLCRECHVNCADLNGRQWIRAEGLLIDRQPSRERRFRAPLLPPDPFQPKSSRLLRALLSHPGREWSQGELGERTGISPGLISRLIRHLHDEGLLSRAKRVVRVSRPDALLDTWAAQDRWEKRTTVRQYSVLASDPKEIASRVRDALKATPLAFTQWFAASLRHPYTIPPIVTAYVRRFPDVEQIEKTLRARPVEEGGRVWLVTPKDEGVFREVQRIEGFTLVSDLQIYLDLLRAGQRGDEQAAELRRWPDFGQHTQS